MSSGSLAALVWLHERVFDEPPVCWRAHRDLPSRWAPRGPRHTTVGPGRAASSRSRLCRCHTAALSGQSPCGPDRESWCCVGMCSLVPTLTFPAAVAPAVVAPAVAGRSRCPARRTVSHAGLPVVCSQPPRASGDASPVVRGGCVCARGAGQSGGSGVPPTPVSTQRTAPLAVVLVRGITCGTGGAAVRAVHGPSSCLLPPTQRRWHGVTGCAAGCVCARRAGSLYAAPDLRRRESQAWAVRGASRATPGFIRGTLGGLPAPDLGRRSRPCAWAQRKPLVM